MTTKTAPQSVEMILVRQLASYLSVPVLVVDTTGTVVFYNEPAARIIGVRFEETGIHPRGISRTRRLGTQHDALAFGQLAGVKHLAPFHHDPGRHDAALEKVLDVAVAEIKPDFPVTPAAEGRASISTELVAFKQLVQPSTRLHRGLLRPSRGCRGTLL